MEDSPVMGLMTGQKKEKTNNGAQDSESKHIPSETTIKKAIWTRASYLIENSEYVFLYFNLYGSLFFGGSREVGGKMEVDIRELCFPRSITNAGLRRLLEEDLELEKHTLDPFKKFISQQVDEVSNCTGVINSPWDLPSFIGA